MMQFMSPLSGRTMGGFALSIGTSLAFESLFDMRQAPYDKARVLPPRVDIRHYKELWINVATLFRNISGAVDAQLYVTVSPREMLEALYQEIDLINSLLAVEGHGSCQPVYYYCDYKSIYTHQNHNAVRLRLDKTDGQKHMAAKLKATMTEFLRTTPELCRQFDSELRPKASESALVITHTPHDLLSYPHFKKLDLLESHTGKLKSRNLWYTKFHKFSDEDLSTIPFIRKFLMIFGDAQTYQPMDIKFRRLLLDISRKRRWTAYTTLDKLLLDLQLDLKEKYLYEMFRQL